MLKAIGEYLLSFSSMQKVEHQHKLVHELGDRHILNDRHKQSLKTVNKYATITLAAYVLPKLIVNLNTVGCGIAALLGAMDADTAMKYIGTGEVLRMATHILQITGPAPAPDQYFKEFYQRQGLEETVAKIEEELAASPTKPI